MMVRRSAISLLFAAATVMAVAAHPHVFINNKMTVVFKQGELEGMTFRWTFDPMFTTMILADVAPNAEGEFTEKQTNQIKTTAFDNLANYHYFLAFVIGKTSLKKIRIEQFSARVVKHNNLVYSFFVPLGLPVTPEEQTVRVTVYDDSYYVAFDLTHADDVTVEGCRCSRSCHHDSRRPVRENAALTSELPLC